MMPEWRKEYQHRAAARHDEPNAREQATKQDEAETLRETIKRMRHTMMHAEEQETS